MWFLSELVFSTEGLAARFKVIIAVVGACQHNTPRTDVSFTHYQHITLRRSGSLSGVIDSNINI